MKNQKAMPAGRQGFIQIIIIVFLIMGIIAVSLASFFVLNTKKEETRETILISGPAAGEESAIQEVGSISTSTDTKTIEKELNDTDLDSIDSDLESLEDSFDSF